MHIFVKILYNFCNKKHLDIFCILTNCVLSIHTLSLINGVKRYELVKDIVLYKNYILLLLFYTHICMTYPVLFIFGSPTNEYML